MYKFISFLVVLAMGSTFAVAEPIDLDEFTSFEFESQQFEVGTPPTTASFQGAEATTLGFSPFIHSGSFAWFVDGDDVGVVEFNVPSEKVEFYARKADSRSTGLVEVFDTDENKLTEVDVPAEFALIAFDAAILGSSIGKITVSNLGAPDQAFAIVDDFGFSAVPEPASMLLMASGLGLFAMRRDKRPA